MGGRIYSLAAPGYTTPVLEGWTSPPAGTSTIWSVTWAPDPASARGAIYWSSPPTLGVGPIGKLVLRFLPPGGSILITPSSVPAMNWIEYDQEVGDFWTVSAAAPPDAAYTMTPAGVFTTVALVPPDGNNGTPAAIDVNDCAADQLRVCPAYVPDPAAPFTAEIGACCEPGDTVVLGIVSPVVLVLGTGQAGANGRVRAVFTGIRLPPGTPGALTFLGACIAPGGPVRLTNTVRWPSN
jgi:hypothetical protein